MVSTGMTRSSSLTPPLASLPVSDDVCTSTYTVDSDTE
jgi:hypothetical protein